MLIIFPLSDIKKRIDAHSAVSRSPIVPFSTDGPAIQQAAKHEVSLAALGNTVHCACQLHGGG